MNQNQNPDKNLTGKDSIMAVIFAVLLIALILGGLGFAAHVLWFAAVIVFAAWLIGFGFGGGASAGARRRWYGRW